MAGHAASASRLHRVEAAVTGAPIPLTNVGGAIASDTTWMLAGSPYVVTNDISISAGVTLTIEAGVYVRFNRRRPLPFAVAVL